MKDVMLALFLYLCFRTIDEYLQVNSILSPIMKYFFHLHCDIFNNQIRCNDITKLKTRYHSVGTVSSYNRKIVVERGKINTHNTQIHDRPLSCLGTSTSCDDPSSY